LRAKKSMVWNRIHTMCELQKVDEDLMYQRAKRVLGIYRDVCWAAVNRTEHIPDEMFDYCSRDLESALVYLEEFAPDKEKEQFEDRVRTLFETRWMLNMIDSAMLMIKEYPKYGDIYFEILSKCYLTRFAYSESEILELMDIERSRFYNRKKEAVMLFGCLFWGTALPKVKYYLNEYK